MSSELQDDIAREKSLMPKYEVTWCRIGQVQVEAGSKEEAKYVFREDSNAYEHESDTEFDIVGVVEVDDRD